jgi:hexosaminidase
MTLYKIVFYCIISQITICASSTINIIPRPNSIKIINSSFNINPNTKIYCSTGALGSTHFLNEAIEKKLGYKLQYISAPLANNCIELRHQETSNKESYTLNIDDKKILITGMEKGNFYGVQSLIQLIQSNGTQVPACEIQDSPRFKWRGMHLDVARHMFPTKDIKKFLRWMAYHKLNTFHWHLTEDQGWRIEI